jgi:hypothetical protein
MRSMLAITVALCSPFPLSAVAARSDRLSLKDGCTSFGSLSERLACLCVLHGGKPVVFFGGVTCYTQFTTPVPGECETGLCGAPMQDCAPGYCEPTTLTQNTSRRHKGAGHPSAYHQWPRHHTVAR